MRGIHTVSGRYVSVRAVVPPVVVTAVVAPVVVLVIAAVVVAVVIEVTAGLGETGKLAQKRGEQHCSCRNPEYCFPVDQSISFEIGS